jgi:hypothetical protein
MRRRIRAGLAVGVASVLVACGGSTANLGGTPGGSDGGTVLEGGGGDAGPTTIATEIQETPTTLVSDGASLFWVSGMGPGGPLSSMPVTGGAITTIVPGLLPGGSDMAVDDVNVYYEGQSGGLYRAPKDGSGSPTLVTDAGAEIAAWTTLGTTVYWLERQEQESSNGFILTVESAPLAGGAPSLVATFSTDVGPGANQIGVDSATVFLSGFGTPLESFAIASGVADGGMPMQLSGGSVQCTNFLSDSDGAYCATASSVIAVADDGTTTTVGPLDTMYQQGLMAVDDTYVYWADGVTVGTIMRAPKAGGAATVIARDADPVAIAVDANAIYWSDEGGNIMRLAK